MTVQIEQPHVLARLLSDIASIPDPARIVLLPHTDLYRYWGSATCPSKLGRAKMRLSVKLVNNRRFQHEETIYTRATSGRSNHTRRVAR